MSLYFAIATLSNIGHNIGSYLVRDFIKNDTLSNNLPCGFDVLETKKCLAMPVPSSSFFNTLTPLCAGPPSSMNMPLALTMRTMKFHEAENVLCLARWDLLHSPFHVHNRKFPGEFLDMI